jgi:hypothetical protein
VCQCSCVHAYVNQCSRTIVARPILTWSWLDGRLFHLIVRVYVASALRATFFIIRISIMQWCQERSSAIHLSRAVDIMLGCNESSKRMVVHLSAAQGAGAVCTAATEDRGAGAEDATTIDIP